MGDGRNGAVLKPALFFLAYTGMLHPCLQHARPKSRYLEPKPRKMIKKNLKVTSGEQNFVLFGPFKVTQVLFETDTERRASEALHAFPRRNRADPGESKQALLMRNCGIIAAEA